MTYKTIPDSETTAEFDVEDTVKTEDEKWRSCIYISETLGGHYKLFIKTEVTNRSTNKSRSEKSHSILLKEHGYLHRFLGYDKYTKKNVPPIRNNVKAQINRLKRKTKTMKSEEELLKELTSEVQNQMDDLDLENVMNDTSK